jgi:hypothetical protein
MSSAALDGDGDVASENMTHELLELVFCSQRDLALGNAVRASAVCKAWRDAARGPVVTAHLIRKFTAGEEYLLTSPLLT